MASSDFIEDAMDLLENDVNTHYILLAAQPGTSTVHRATRIASRKQLEWFKKAADKLFARLEAELVDE